MMNKIFGLLAPIVPPTGCGCAVPHLAHNQRLSKRHTCERRSLVNWSVFKHDRAVHSETRYDDLHSPIVLLQRERHAIRD